MSKGSRQRPRQVNLESFESNWDRIFGKKSKNNTKEPTKKSIDTTKNKS